VVGGHFRGGRSNEVSYLIDGVSVTDPFNGGLGLMVENSSIRQMEVISGAFNAEYGQAMSGVVNIVTQEGSSTYHGAFSGYVGDYFTKHSSTFPNLDKFSTPRIRNAQATLSGPIVGDLSFFATGRFLENEGYLYGRRVFRTTDDVPIFPDQNNPSFYFNRNTGDSAFVSMNPSRRWSLNGKLTYAFPGVKVSVSSFYEDAWNKYYSHAYAQTPDGIMHHYHRSQLHNFQVTHALSQNTFQSLKLSYNYFDYRGYLYQDPYDLRYVDPNRGTPISGYTFRSGGNQGDRYERNTRSLLAQWSLTSQISKEHKIGIGIEGQFYRIYNHGYSVYNLTENQYDSTGSPIFTIGYRQLGVIGNQAYKKNPWQLSGYIQDKMEYDIMIINAGVRADYFNPRSSFPVDLRNPSNNPAFPGAFQKAKAGRKFQLSPRLGVSFPITDQGIIHFSYGHFFQIPSFENLYVNSEYLVTPGSSLSSVTGNPDLDAQRTVSYELGLQQVLFEVFSLDVTAYYRDIRNYLGMEIINTYEGTKYARFINRDYANVRGFIISLEKRFADAFSVKADYTFQFAEGNSSDPYTVYNNNQTDPPIETPKTVVPLNWDQRHTLNLSVTVGNLGDWTASLLFQYGSGQPYTEDVRVSQGLRFENGGNRPAFYNLDFRAEKSFPLLGTNVNTFLLIYNLLDIKNEVNVNSATGRANVDIFTKFAGTVYGLNTIEQYLNDPTSFSTPREVRLGLSVEF
jgi:outer membrane receptor protein involved in Fe transport